VRTRLSIAGVVVAVTGVVLSVVFLTGNPVAVNTGPLGGGPVNGSVCIAGRQISPIAEDDFRNATSSPILVEKSTLVNAHGIRMLGIDLVPIVAVGGGYDLLPTGGPYPPSRAELAAVADARWGDRHALPMIMPPDQPGHSWDLVFGLERTGNVGTADYYQLQYEWRGRQYSWSSSMAVKLLAGPCS
jgi:hypothetical protein